MEITGPFREKIYFKEKIIKSLFKKKNYYFFIDSFFKSHKIFKNCENVMFLKSEEGIKSLVTFNKLMEWLLKNRANKSSTFVAIGGGSIGDSIGFLASVYLRGVEFIQVPTTWLAAIDSSIGGKTALNYGGYKNQIGTIYPPKEIYFFLELLNTAKIKDSEGEIIKTLFLNVNKIWSKKILSKWSKDKINFKDLPLFISYKTSIVKKDVRDIKDIRAVLNLGHTIGHVLELMCGFSHSDAVKKGLLFSIRWSYKRKYLSLRNMNCFLNLLDHKLPRVSDEKLFKALLKDKKSKGNIVNFIFLRNNGPFLKKVKIFDLIKEYKRQIENEC